ncbi:hypothetical protein MMC24_000011 [Lignoscripta atroalba]|nr:hypothetical protein [Lignoscripta atroalba]
MAASFIRRPTSPLHYDPLIPEPEDVLYPGTEDEESSQGYRAKRRRVEALGQQYLHGVPLFILSAGLRGPFHDGWVNPWAKKSRSSLHSRRALKQQRQKSDRTETAVHLVVANARLREGGVPIPTTQRPSKSLESLITNFGTATRPLHNLQSPDEDRRSFQGDRQSGFDKANADMLARDPALCVGSNAIAKHEIIELDSIMGPEKEKDWLRSDQAFLKKRSRVRSKSPTPTPMVREHRKHDAATSITPQRPTNAKVIPQPRIKQPERINSFTPINQLGHIPEGAKIFRDKENPTNRATPLSPQKDPLAVSSTGLYNTTINVSPPTRRKLLVAEELSLETSSPGKDHAFQSEVQKLSSNEGPGPVQQLPVSTLSPPHPDAFHEKAGIPLDIKIPTTTVPKVLARSPRVVSPSTYLPEFTYHRAPRASKTPSRPSSPFAERLEAAKVQAVRAQAARHLSFTAYGKVNFGTRTPTKGSPGSPCEVPEANSPLKHIQSIDKDLSPETPARVPGPTQELVVLRAVDDHTSNATNVLTNDLLPEAQVIAEQAGQNVPLPSGPSTNLLETDKQSLKFPSTEEGDSDIYMSTQAAMAKAQKSFQSDLISPAKEWPDHSLTAIVRKDKDPSTKPVSEAVKPAITPFRTFRNPYAGAAHGNPESNDEEPMSTQAMVDAITPFAISTVKKPALKKKASFAPSPTDGKNAFPTADTNSEFGKLGLDMETSPDVSDHEMRPPTADKTKKPSASGRSKQSSGSHPSTTPASLSLAPNGTASEGYHQDGQRLHSSWDLNDAIDEAGSFLGTWDVENEIRNGSAFSGASGSLQNQNQNHQARGPSTFSGRRKS